MSDLHAAIDIGTNSIHLVVARALPDGGFDVVTTEKESVRLGSGGGDMKLLTDDAMDRGVAALAHMMDVAAALGAEITAVATSAVREAENREVFVNRVARELGLGIDVIAGLEEARLIHNGVIHAVDLAGRRSLMVDIGGGSTEFIVSEGPELVEARSLRLGAIRLTERFFGGLAPEEPPPARAVEACRRHLRNVLGGVVRQLGGHRPEMLVGSSGTMEAVATMVAEAAGGEPHQLNGFAFTADQLDPVVEAVLAVGTDRRPLAVPGLEEKRADIIVGGILLVQETLRAFELDSVTISEFALREGVLYDRFPAGADHLRDLRRSNVRRLARKFDPDADHAETAARLAVQLFDRTVDLHGLDRRARQLLELAALVHNVGLTVAHSGHHKHTYYIVRNSELLTGFTDHELELLALIARYHRKSHPKPEHDEFDALDADDQYLVRVSAGLLRIAIGLDRRHLGLVRGVTARVEQGDGERDRLLIEPVADGADVGPEIAAAGDRARLAGLALGVDVVVQARPDDD